MLELFSEETLKNPHPLYAQLRAARGVHHDLERGLWFLFEYDAVKRALSDHDAFGSAVAADGQVARWLIFSDPPRHTRLRALIGRAFTSRTVAALEPRIRELSRALLAATREKDEFDFVDGFSLPLPMQVIAELLGAPIADFRLFRRWSDVMMGLIATLDGGPRAERAARDYAQTTDEMQVYLAALLAARRAAPAADLISSLAVAELDGTRLSEPEILGFFQLLLLAGHETTTNLLGNALLSWLEHPGCVERLRADPALVPAFVEEVLRYRSPVQAMFRIALRDVSNGDRTIERGSVVLAMVGAANRDPAHFPEADRFDLTRQPNPHLAFGHGIHFCVGAPLARLEARVALDEYLSHVERFELAGAWRPRHAFHVHGPAALPLRVAWAERRL
jgi:cytochrome P450